MLWTAATKDAVQYLGLAVFPEILVIGEYAPPATPPVEKPTPVRIKGLATSVTPTTAIVAPVATIARLGRRFQGRVDVGDKGCDGAKEGVSGEDEEFVEAEGIDERRRRRAKKRNEVMFCKK